MRVTSDVRCHHLMSDVRPRGHSGEREERDCSDLDTETGDTTSCTDLNIHRAALQSPVSVGIT